MYRSRPGSKHGASTAPPRTATAPCRTSIAERVGFEPTEPQAAQRFSRPPDSTALASLQAPGWREGVRVHGCTKRTPNPPRTERGRRVQGRRTRRTGTPVRTSGDQAPRWREGGNPHGLPRRNRGPPPWAWHRCHPICSRTGRSIAPQRAAKALNTRSPLATSARGDQVLRAQEDSNLRPLDPQSNALSRLSYGHSAHPTVPACAMPPRTQKACRIRADSAQLVRRGGDSNPRYPLGVQRLSRAPDSATLAPLPSQPAPSRPLTLRSEAASSSSAQRGGARDT